MTAIRRLVASVAGVIAVASLASAQVLVRPAATQVQAGARAGVVAPGGIQGVVLDDRGEPLGGAMVSALGLTNAFTVTDHQGRFLLRPLPPGAYLVRAHLGGYALSRARLVQLGPDAGAMSTIALRRIGARPAGSIDAADEAPVLAASLAGTVQEPDPPDAEPLEAEDAGTHDHSEMAWRLRHLHRSVLRDTAMMPVAADSGDDAGSEQESEPVRLAANIFGDLPLSGQINLLATGTFDSPEDLFADDRAPHSVAYLSIGAPAGTHGDWMVRGALTQGDLASWALAGSYATRSNARHAYEVGMSYSMQRYEGGNAAALVAVTDGTRNAGEVYGFDRWAVANRLTLGYGARYANYDYLEQGPLVSPRLSVGLRPFRHTRVETLMSRRMLAPGAEEFSEPAAGGLWLPPERTFSPIGADATFRPERTDHYQVSLEQDVHHAFVGVRAFYQKVDDQLVTLFGVEPSSQPSNLGHYYVGTAGSFEARGWGVSLGHTLAGRLRGVVDYSVTEADWRPSPQAELVSIWAASAVRQNQEQLHDLTTSVEADIPETATRVFVMYRINSAYSRATAVESRPGADARFDVQVNQSLPFLNFIATEWEMLVAVRNLFREMVVDGSVYDELLVVRPPKRIVGGLKVRF